MGLAATLALGAAAGCAYQIPPLDPDAPVRSDIDVPFDNQALKLHLSRPGVIDPGVR